MKFSLSTAIIWSGYVAAIIGLVAGGSSLVYACMVDKAEMVEISRQGGLIIVGMLFVSLAMVCILTTSNIRLRGASR